MLSHRRSVLFLFIFLALSGLAYYAYHAWHGSNSAPAAAMAAPGGFSLPVETAKVQTLDLAVDAQALGSLRANESVVLRPEIAGRIAAINFKEGSLVKQGTVLLKLDAATQLAEVAQAKANLELARTTQKRNQSLFAQRFVSQQALDQSTAALEVQAATLGQAEAKLGKTRLIAPFTGVIGIRNVSLGDYVQEGQTLINLEDLSQMKIDFRLPESAASQLKPGQSIEVSSDTLPGKSFTAVLDAINPLVDAASRSIACRAHLLEANSQLKPGMFVRVRVIFASLKSVLLVPEQALVPDVQGAFVFRLVAGKAVRTPVRIGLRQVGRVQIVEGLSSDDEVVIAGQLKLQDGMPIQAIKHENKPSLDQAAPEKTEKVDGKSV